MQLVSHSKHECGDMALLSIEASELPQSDSITYFKLREAEQEAESTDRRYSLNEVLQAMRDAINEIA